MTDQAVIDHLVSESMDAYLKMPVEQAMQFDAWLTEELESGRLSDRPGAEVLNLATRAWLSGWNRGRSELVEGVHSL